MICTIQNLTYTIVSVYVPNTHQLRFLRKLHKKVQKVQQGSTIWCGDFNINPDPTLDSTSTSKRGKPALNPLLSSLRLYDIWRCQHAEEKDFTFFSPCHNTYSRIDLFLSDQWTLQKISSSTILSATWSDHSPISITIEDNKAPNPTYLWRLNTNLLQSEAYSSMIRLQL